MHENAKSICQLKQYEYTVGVHGCIYRTRSSCYQMINDFEDIGKNKCTGAFRKNVKKQTENV